MIFVGKSALVTGAGSGIGRAIARKLLAAGATVCITGRRTAPLAETAAGEARAQIVPADLATVAGIDELCRHSGSVLGRLDILVHSAGLYSRDDAPSLAEMHAVNAQAPERLSRRLLPLLTAARGEVVFVNSTIVASEPPGLAAYRESKLALRAFADRLRGEVNAVGVRVTSLYVGRTATPMQERIFAEEGREWQPDRLLQPADVAAAIVGAISLPRTAEITDLTIRPMQKS